MADPLAVLTIFVLAAGALSVLTREFFRTGDPFSPIGFVGLFWLSYYVGPAIDLATMTAAKRSRLLLDHGLWYAVPGLALCLLGTVSLVVGWRLGTVKFRVTDTDRRLRIEPRRMRRLQYIFGSIGLVGLFLFLQSTGGIPTSVAELSNKRDLPTVYIRWLTEFLFLASLLAWLRYSETTESFLQSRTAVPLLWLGIALVPPFLGSNRGMLLLIVISHIVLIHYIYRPVKIREILPLAPAAILAVGIMHWLRQISDGASAIRIDSFGLVFDSLQSAFGADYGSLTVITHLVHLVPIELGYRYGTTLFKWTVFPIPRSVWPSKPVNLGQVLGSEIYGRPNGTPPTLIGELYLNFDFVGVLVGMLVVGIAFRMLYQNLVLERHRLPVTVLLYIVVIVSGFGVADLTKTMTSLLRWLLPLAVGLYYASYSERIPTSRSHG